MKPSKNCAIPVDGQYAYVAPPQERGDLDRYIAEVERVDSAEGFRNASGVYTWILYRTADDPTIKFAAALVRSVIELGTLHHALARGTGAVTVHGAGELRKRDPAKHEILINFQSGSFMEKWALPETCTLGEMERFLLAKIRPILKGLKVDTPRKSSFITDEMTPPTMQELQLYASKGFKVCLYADRESCWKGKGTCENPLPVEQMKGGNQERPTPRKARLLGVPYVPPELPQKNEAERMLAFGELSRPEPTAPPKVPESKLPGMGGRKKRTRKTKMRARKTRRRLRGGNGDENPDWEVLDPNHVGVRMAESLLAEPPPPRRALSAAAAEFVPAPPEARMFDELARELHLSVPQRQYMVNTYYEARDRNVPLTKEMLRTHLLQWMRRR